MVDLLSTNTLETNMHKSKGPSSENSPFALVIMWYSLLLYTLFRHSGEQEFIRQVIICQDAWASLVMILSPATSNLNLTLAYFLDSFTVTRPYLWKIS